MVKILYDLTIVGVFMSSHTDLIRKLAHQIWEAEGKPDGQAELHWERAKILAAESPDPAKAGLKRSIDPSESSAPTELAQPDQT